MDLGTIYKRLLSRNHYSSVRQYLDDVRLMCENAMLYNPRESIYYQKARKVDFIPFFSFAHIFVLIDNFHSLKMLAFAEKQLSPQGLRKLSAELLKNSRPLTDEEMGVSSTTETSRHHHHHHHGHHSRHHRDESQMDFRLDLCYFFIPFRFYIWLYLISLLTFSKRRSIKISILLYKCGLLLM